MDHLPPTDVLSCRTVFFVVGTYGTIFKYADISWYRTSSPQLQEHIYAWSGFRIRITLMPIRIRITLFTLMRIRIQLFTSIRIRILLLIKVMGICDHWPTDSPGLQFEPPSLHFEHPGPSTAPFFWSLESHWIWGSNAVCLYFLVLCYYL